MVQAQHTPGPWVAEEVRTQCGRAFRIGSGEMLSAGKGCCIIYDDYPGNPDNERRANAHLIAAAPEMLATLGEAAFGMDEAVRILDLMGRGGDARNLQRLASNARAVIRKAEGVA